MNYKETLFFVAKGLTIIDEEKNRFEVKKQIKDTNINWEAVVKLSTAHYVLPAFYCNLKYVGFLKYLPKDLVEFMENITNLNRARNQKLLQEAKELNKYLQIHNIKPIFLKGISHLIGGIYHDLGERMISDIDFLVDIKVYQKTIELVKDFGYTQHGNELPDYHRHFPTLISNKNIGAIEIHKELLRTKYSSYFNFNTIKNNLINIDNCYLIDYEEQLYHIILSYQINDFGKQFKLINLRTSYDVYRLGKLIKKQHLKTKSDKITIHINNYLKITNEVFNDVLNLHFNNYNKKYVQKFYKLLEKPKNIKKRMTIIYLQNKIIDRLKLFIKSTYSVSHRKWLFLTTKLKLRKYTSK